MKIVRASLVLALVAATVGCGPGLLKESRVKDTPKNRQIYNLVQRYRLAMENRDVKTIRGLISRDYFENASTTDKTKDDYGYEKMMQKVLPLLKNNIKKLRYAVFVRKITFKGATHASAEYEYLARYRITEGGKSTWKVKNDFNKIDFAKEKGKWKIVSGL